MIPAVLDRLIELLNPKVVQILLAADRTFTLIIPRWVESDGGLARRRDGFPGVPV